MVWRLVSRADRAARIGDGFAGADLAGDHADAAFGDAPADPGDGFAVGGVAVQHAGGEVAAEGHAGEPVEALQFVDHGVTCLSLSVGGGELGFFAGEQVELSGKHAVGVGGGYRGGA